MLQVPNPFGLHPTWQHHTSRRQSPGGCPQLPAKDRDRDGAGEDVLAPVPTCTRSLSSVEGICGGSRTCNNSIFCKAESVIIYMMLEISYSQYRFNHAIIRLLSFISQ